MAYGIFPVNLSHVSLLLRIIFEIEVGELLGYWLILPFVILLGTFPALHFPDADRIIHSLDRRQQRRM